MSNYKFLAILVFFASNQCNTAELYCYEIHGFLLEQHGDLQLMCS